MAKPLNPIGLKINEEAPRVMHVDMNSCFATIEQQANPLLRGRPIAVTAYSTPGGIIIAPSVESKALGIRLGMTVREAKLICPDLFVLEPDTAKYRDAHIRFKKIFMSYTDKVSPKSIDEAVIDFRGSRIIERKHMLDIGREIKRRVKEDIGVAVRVNVGIGTNRFLAKTAAGLNKPDGLEMITHQNLLKVYEQMELLDITGINFRNEARLNSWGIFTPLQFFDADVQFLKRNVFHSIVGYYWYLRLRGWEIDDVDTQRKSYGHMYALGQKTAKKEELAPMLMKLSEKAGRRLRHGGYYGSGVYLSLVYDDRTEWHKSRRTKSHLYTSQDIFRHIMLLFNHQPNRKTVTHLHISVYGLEAYWPNQTTIFDGTKADIEALSRAVDIVNDRYGEFTVMPAEMLKVKDIIYDRVAFGGVRDLEDLYQED